MPPSATVVIVSRRPGDWLAEAVASALPQADEVVRSAANVGFAGGVELGRAQATGDVVALLNDDAVAEPGWIAAACAALEDPTVAAVTPKVLLDGTYGEIVLDDDAWFAPGDARPLGRQVRSVTVHGVEVLEAVRGAGVHELAHDGGNGHDGCDEGDGDDGRQAWRWTAGPRPFYVPLPDAHASGDVAVDGEPVTVRTTCRLVNHAGAFLEHHGAAGDYGLGAPDDGRFDEPAERFGFSGTAPVIRADTFGRLGGFCRPFFAYYEDTDWCFRARLAGMRIVYDPTASVRHRLSATSEGPNAQMVRFLAQRNALLCALRNAPGDVARRLLWRRIADGPGDGARRGVLDKLPWALASRARLHRHWQVSPRQVWNRWAGVDTRWNAGPARQRPT